MKMALLKNGLTWTVWALSGLVAFFFGLVGASPPAWAESGVRMAQAVRPSAQTPRPPAPPRVEKPSEHKMGEVIPKLEISQPPLEAKGHKVREVNPKLKGLPGQSHGTTFPKVEMPQPPSEAEGYMKIEGIKGESLGKVIPKVEIEER